MSENKNPVSSGKEMGFFDHVDELRKYLLRSALVILISAIFVFVYVTEIFDRIILGPAHSDFWSYRKLCEFSNYLYGDDRMCFKLGELNFQILEIQGEFMMAFKIAVIGGLVISFPFIVYQLWLFVKPALNPTESKKTRGFVFYLTFLFFLGIMFGYFILCPISINFFSNFSLSGLINKQPTATNIMNLVTTLTLGTGLVFELPMLMYFLSRIGLLKAAFLKKYRKHSYVVILIISALITPPDVISQMILALPLILLFETGIGIAKRVEKNKKNEFET